MPKLIVLVFGSNASAKTLADALAEGAKGIRFTEVDVRAGERGESRVSSRLKPLGAMDDLAHYDGIAITCGAPAEMPDDAGMPDDMVALLDELEATTSATVLANTVFAVVGGTASQLARVAQLGGIIVAEPRGFTDPFVRAKAHGARVAKVIEWVRHALSHEQKDVAHHHHH